MDTVPSAAAAHHASPEVSRHPRRDRLLALFFGIAIAFPLVAMLLGPGVLALRSENRNATPWPSLSLDPSFPSTFEKAFADRFGGRAPLVGVHHLVLASVFHTSPVPQVVLGKGQWLFLSNADAKAWTVTGADASSALRTQAIVTGIEQRISAAAREGIEYALVVVPDKQTLYAQFLPFPPPAARSRLDDVLAHLSAEARLHVLDLRAPLREAMQSDEVYYRTDTHWNVLGAWVGYVEIGRHLGIFGPASTPARPKRWATEMATGDLGYMLGLPLLFREPVPELQFGPCGYGRPGTDADWQTDEQTMRCPDGLRRSAILYHDSMGMPLRSLVPSLFVESRWTRRSAWNPATDFAFRPQFVIDEVVERNLESLADAWFLEGPDVVVERLPATRLWLQNPPYGRGAKPSADASCRAVAADVAAGSPGMLHVSGSTTGRVPAGDAPESWLLLDGRNTYRLRVLLRLDPNDEARSSFDVEAQLAEVRPGAYELSLVTYREGEWARCELGRRVQI